MSLSAFKMEKKTLLLSFDPYYLEMIDLEIDGNLRKFVHLVGLVREMFLPLSFPKSCLIEANLVEVLPFCPNMRLTGQPRDWQRLYVHLFHRSGDPQTVHYET